MKAVEQAIIPVAGFGLRRLPVTKAIEKCMLPVDDWPIVDYAVRDCLLAGASEITFVVNEQSTQLRTFYGRNLLLEKYLRARGKLEQLEQISSIGRRAIFHYVVQDQAQPYGTAVPVAL